MNSHHSRSVSEKKSEKSIALVVFDMDGTLTVPNLDFTEIRKAIGIEDSPLLTLDHLKTLSGKERDYAFGILHKYEEEAANNAAAQDGALELLAYLKTEKIITAVQTRNSQHCVDITFRKLGITIDHIFTRDNSPPKPDPSAILELIQLYNLDKSQVIMVGDFWADIETGQNAGIRTVFLENGSAMESKFEADETIQNLLELVPIIDKWSQTSTE